MLYPFLLEQASGLRSDLPFLASVDLLDEAEARRFDLGTEEVTTAWDSHEEQLRLRTEIRAQVME